jgi:hypothetical protein
VRIDCDLLDIVVYAETPQIIGRLLGAVQRGIDFLKNEKEQRKVRGDAWQGGCAMVQAMDRLAHPTMRTDAGTGCSTIDSTP